MCARERERESVCVRDIYVLYIERESVCKREPEREKQRERKGER